MIRVIPMRGMARPTTWNFATPASYQPLPSGGFAQTISLSGLRRHHLRVCGQRQMGRPCSWNFDTPASYEQIPCTGGTYAQQVSLSGWRAGRRLRGLGQDTFTDPATGCVSDSDGNLLSCPGGVDPYQQIGEQAAQSSNAPALPQQPTNATIYPDGTTILPNGTVVTPAPSAQPPSGGGRGVGAWLSQPVSPGWPSNGAVIGIAAGATALFSMLGRGRRR